MGSENVIWDKIIFAGIVMLGFLLMYAFIRIEENSDNIHALTLSVQSQNADINRLYQERFFLWLGLNRNVTFDMPSCFPGFQAYDWRQAYIAPDRALLKLNSTVIYDVVLVPGHPTSCYDANASLIDCRTAC